MRSPRAAGRPKAISREMLEEAACELFLERGYGETSVADITRRAGVSRATFFNYVDSKAGLLWASVDDALEQVEAVLADAAVGAPGVSGVSGGLGARGGLGALALERVRAVLLEAARGMQPGVAVLAIANADAMGVAEELVLTGAGRQARLAEALADVLRAAGMGSLEADVSSRAHAGAFFAALHSWALGDPGAHSFADEVARALAFL